MAGCLGACQAAWMKSLMEELKLRSPKPVKMLLDNQSAINLAKNPVAHGRTKHIESRYHYLRDQVSKQKLEVEFCKSQLQVADAMTKPLKSERFLELRAMLGMKSLEYLN
jgi:hypothetical protein